MSAYQLLKHLVRRTYKTFKINLPKQARGIPFKSKLSFFIFLALVMCSLLQNFRCVKQTHGESEKKSGENGNRERFTYFQPTSCPQQQQNISATVCIPESIILSSCGPVVIFALIADDRFT